jgi:hypothetical protein
MKKIAGLLMIIAIIFDGCSKNKEDGKLKVKVNYSISGENKNAIYEKNNIVKSVRSVEEDNYSQIGNFITSITPTEFSARFLDMTFYSDKELNQGGYRLTLIDGNLPANDSSRYANFTNGNSVTINPTLFASDKTNLFFSGGEIKFIYLSFSLDYFYQEVLLPVQYETVTLNQFNHRYGNNDYFSEIVKIGHTLKVDSYPIIDKVIAQNQGVLSTFIFGNTNSSKIVYPGLDPVDPALAPFGNINGNFVWSKNYQALTAIMPAHDESRTITCTLSFDISNLIQIYAGSDNISYTSDDVIIYAPNFWDRIHVTTTQN